MKPRDFWIDPNKYPDEADQVRDVETQTHTLHVREVVPIDWEQVWFEYTGSSKILNKELLQKLVEKQLKGE